MGTNKMVHNKGFYLLQLVLKTSRAKWLRGEREEARSPISLGGAILRPEPSLPNLHMISGDLPICARCYAHAWQCSEPICVVLLDEPHIPSHRWIEGKHHKHQRALQA